MTVDVDGNYQLLAQLQPTSFSLVSGLAATKCSVGIHQMQTLSTALSHDDSTINNYCPSTIVDMETYRLLYVLSVTHQIDKVWQQISRREVIGTERNFACS